MRGVLGDRSSVDHRHLSLLADTMSNRGFFMSIDRHGINNRGELGPLAKCSFEQTTDMLIKAGVFAERDRINGVSANIMLGQVAPCGTGDCEVLMDGKALAAYGTVISFDDETVAASHEAANGQVDENAVMLPDFAAKPEEEQQEEPQEEQQDAKKPAKKNMTRRVAEDLVIE